jgi:hypothetical protein
MREMTDCNLDRPMIQEKGDWIKGDVVKRNRRLWEIVSEFAKQALSQFSEGDEVPPMVKIPNNDRYGGALHILQKIYAIGADEVRILELFSSQFSVDQLWLLAADWPTYIEAIKKKQQVNHGSVQSLTHGNED